MIDWDKAIPVIEKALGFQLHEWQIRYLKTGEYIRFGRVTGRTTAYCIRFALTHDKPIRFENIRKHQDEDHGWGYHLWFERFFFKIWHRLRDAGLPVVDIILKSGENSKIGKML